MIHRNTLRQCLNSRAIRLAFVALGCCLGSALMGSSARADDDLFDIQTNFVGQQLVHAVGALENDGIHLEIEIKDDRIHIDATSADGQRDQDETIHYADDWDDEDYFPYLLLSILTSHADDTVSIHVDESVGIPGLNLDVDLGDGDDHLQITADDDDAGNDPLGTYSRIKCFAGDDDDVITNDSVIHSIQHGGDGADTLQGGWGWDELCPFDFLADDGLRLVNDDDTDVMSDLGGGVEISQIAWPVVDSVDTEFGPPSITLEELKTQSKLPISPITSSPGRSRRQPSRFVFPEANPANPAEPSLVKKSTTTFYKWRKNQDDMIFFNEQTPTTFRTHFGEYIEGDSNLYFLETQVSVLSWWTNAPPIEPTVVNH